MMPQLCPDGCFSCVNKENEVGEKGVGSRCAPHSRSPVSLIVPPKSSSQTLSLSAVHLRVRTYVSELHTLKMVVVICLITLIPRSDRSSQLLGERTLCCSRPRL